jgi:GTPase SAR1 family protein
MSADNQSSSNALPFREGALGPEEIRGKCPQFRILVIGKANAGKTTILRKVCNAKPDAKPIVYDAEGVKLIVDDAEGKKIKRDLADVRHANLMESQGQTNTTLGLGSFSGCGRFLDG